MNSATVAPSRTLLRDIHQRMGIRAWLLLGALLANSLAEGMGLALMFPLLGHLGLEDPNVAASALGTATERFFAMIGLGTELLPLLALIIFVFVLQNGIFLTQSWAAAVCQHRYTAAWRHDLFDAFLHARWRFFTETRSADLINAIIRETNRISGAFLLLIQIAAAGLFMLVYLALAFAAAWQVAVLLLAFGMIMFVATRPLISRAHAVGVEVSRRNEALQSSASEFLGGAKLIKATASEAIVMKHVTRVIEDNFTVDRWSSFNPNLIKSIYEIAAVVLLCAMIVAAVSYLTVSTAGLLVAIYMFARLYSRLASMQQSYQLFNINVAALLNAQGILARASAEQERQPKEVERRIAGLGPVSVRIENLIAGHAGAPVVRDVSMDVQAGGVIALVGPSGAGKSTIVDCLLGLIEPLQGKITVNDAVFSELSLSDWRRTVGYVAQDTVLFHDTVRANIRWGNPDATDEEIAAASRIANAHEFVSSMPQGYDTIVGDSGMRLSGGQRQRLGLARALVGDKALLILDEPTSALDSESEAVVLDAIRKLYGQITIIVVAHRLATVRNADFIYVLQDGRIAESGDWDSLIERGDRFTSLWRMQSAQA